MFQPKLIMCPHSQQAETQVWPSLLMFPRLLLQGRCEAYGGPTPPRCIITCQPIMEVIRRHNNVLLTYIEFYGAPPTHFYSDHRQGLIINYFGPCCVWAARTEGRRSRELQKMGPPAWSSTFNQNVKLCPCPQPNQRASQPVDISRSKQASLQGSIQYPVNCVLIVETREVHTPWALHSNCASGCVCCDCHTTRQTDM